MENNQSTIFQGLSVTPTLKIKLQSVALWGKVCAITAFLAQAIQLLAAVKNNTLMQQLIGAGITVFLNILLLNFSLKLSSALETNDEGLLTESFSNLRRYYLVTLILIAIVIVLIILGLLLLMFAGGLGLAK